MAMNVQVQPPLGDADEAAADDLPLFEAPVAAADQGIRLDAWLARMQPQFSRSHWQRLIDAAQVQVDGATARTAR
ncbi:MAG: hypothetical protein KGQ77_11995, partial [Betaproteobacteria bacterium]|nr:hypothetical protein [Betaproteobacteria bacterium]